MGYLSKSSRYDIERKLSPNDHLLFAGMQKEGASSERKGTVHMSEIHVAKNRQVQDGATMGEVGKGSTDEGKTALL